ncbi:unnamed protein product [Blepharisma stoltei]|uniref:EGF-like domain-containing protein n=1 Tax=Blepharisma stoltei TaxID=1481888 RepID=A0AAU9IYZ2_9CILI|nr:unnamed protein product [Blepharisma stoltei]
MSKLILFWFLLPFSLLQAVELDDSVLVNDGTDVYIEFTLVPKSHAKKLNQQSKTDTKRLLQDNSESCEKEMIIDATLFKFSTGCCPKSTYFDGKKCIPCPDGCVDCKDITGECINCRPELALDVEIIRKSPCCLEGSFYSGSGCEKCPENCLSCNSTTSCARCRSEMTADIKIKSKKSCCPKGTFYNGSECASCTPNCSECEDITQKCISCEKEMALDIKIANSKPCCSPSSYYNGIKCMPCPENCLECDDFGICKTCDKEMDLDITIKGKGKCCPKGQLYNIIENECKSCSPNCLECEKLGSCSTCDKEMTLDLAIIIPKKCCPQGLFYDKIEKICKSCSTNCLECEKSNECQSCDKEMTLDMILVSRSKCCPKGKFYDLAENICKTCLGGCLECEGPSKCNSCDKEMTLDIAISNSKKCCLEGEFYDSTQKICKSCLPNCSECDGESDCQLCEKEMTVDTTIISSKMCCHQGQFYDKSENGCKPCSDNCLECSGKDKCYSCKEEMTLDLAISKTKKCCSPGEFYDKKEKICKPCSANCFDCEDSNDCKSCDKEMTVDTTIISSKKCCPSGQFYSTPDHECRPCLSNCSFCDNPDKCRSCDKEMTLDAQIVSSKKCCPEGEFYDFSTKGCIPCSENCLACENANECSSCQKEMILDIEVLGIKKCCPTGQFYDKAEDLCKDCSSNCLACEGQSDCNSCEKEMTLETLIVSSKKCCPPGQFYDSSGKKCTPCSDNCLDCDDLSDCKSCGKEMTLDITLTSSSKCCPKGEFYDLAENECKLCLGNCLECEGPSKCRSCTKDMTLDIAIVSSKKCCPDGYFYNSTQNACQCSPGNYFNGSKCLPCPKGCIECEDITGICKDCSNQMIVDLKIKSSRSCCSSSHYYDGLDCQPCQSGCLNCKDISGECYSCKPEIALDVAIIKKTTCCPDKHYSDGLNCLPCGIMCDDCISATNCSACDDQNLQEVDLLSPGNCKCVGSAYYDGETCQACSFLCSVCNATECSQCIDSANMIQDPSNISSCKCKEQFYYENTTKLCQPCMENCLTCFDASSCTQCKSGYYYDGFSCLISSCPNGTYIENNTCTDCIAPCATCYNSSFCYSCINPEIMVLNPTSGVCSCPSGQFYDANSQECSSCKSPCSTCFESADFCLSCIDSTMDYDSTYGTCLCQVSKYLESEKCIDCVSPCETCSSSDFCLSCADSAMVYDEISGVCACPDKKYFNYSTKSCEDCEGICEKCLNSTFCLTCKDSTMTYNSTTGTCSCPSNYYFNKDSLSCQSCHETCEDCLDSTSCTSCIDSAMKYDNNTKLCTCGETQYFNSAAKACQDCKGPCKSCTSETFCTSCLDTSTLDISTGTCSCSQHEYFNASLSQCKECSGLCSTCLSDAICDSCVSNTNPINNGICSCLTGFYLSSKECLQCPSPCSSCSSNTKCDTCKSHAYLDSTDQFCHCQTGFTLSSSDSSGYCKADCNSYCTECDIDNGNKCSKCITNAELSETTCSCTENSAYDSATKSCLCNSGYILSNSKCVACKKYLSPTDIKSADFSSAWTYLYVYFNVKLDTSLDPGCSKVFEASTYVLLGSSPICSWADSKTLKVALGTYYGLRTQTIYLDGTYLVKDTTDSCTTAYQPLSIAISSTAPPSPIAVISGQTNLYLSCGTDALVYSGERSQMGLGSPLSYSWSARISPSNKSLLDFITSQNTPSISISRSYFPTSVSTTLAVTLNATNFLGYSNQASLTTTINAGSALSIIFDQGNSVSMWYSSSKTLKAKITSYCSTFTSSPASWTWSYDTSTSPSINYDAILKNAKSDKLTIPKNTLPVGGPYTFIASASQVNANATLTGSGKVSITVTASPLIIQLSKTSGDVSPSEDYIINAIGSKDPDDPNGTLNYKWICQNSEDESDCLGSDGEILLVDETAATLTIPTSRMVKGALWDIICTISKDTRSASAMVEINILNISTEISIAITMTLQKFSPQQNIQFSASINSNAPAQILWSEKTGADISISPNYLSSISFPSSSLIEGSSYIFTLTITIDSSNLQFVTQLPVTVNSGASCSGDFILSPSSGTALVTMFNLGISGCYDKDESDYPLTYTYFDAWNSKLYVLGYTSETNSIQAYLLPNKNSLTVHVCDSLKTCADYSTEITTSEYSSRLLQTSSLMDAYLMNIIDTDNIPSTIAIFCSSATIEASLFSQMWSDLQSYVENNDIDENLLGSVLGSVYAMAGQTSLVTIEMFQSMFDWLDGILSDNPTVVPTQENIKIVVALVDDYLLYGNSTNYEGKALEEYIIAADKFLSTWTVAATANDLVTQSALDGSQNTIQTKVFKHRNFPSAMTNKTISLGENRTVSFPSHFSYPDTDIMNIKVDYYNTSNDYSDVAVLSFAQSGAYKSYALTKSAEEYVPFSSQDYPVTLEMPIYDSIEDGYNWTCVFYNETDKDWVYDGCSIKEIKEKSIIFEVYHFSMYKLGQTKIAIPDLPTPTDSESCPQNYAPVYILASVFFFILILIPIIIFLDRADHKEKRSIKVAPVNSPADRSLDNSQQKNDNLHFGQNTFVQDLDGSVEIKHEEIVERRDIILEEPKIDEKIELESEDVSKTELALLFEGHLVFGLIYYRKNYSRKARLFVLGTVIVFELFLEGLLLYVFENTKSGFSASAETLFGDYEGKYFAYIVLALGITIPIEIFLSLVFSTRRIKTLGLLVTVTSIEIIILLGSPIGIIMLSNIFCSEWSGYWAISFLYGTLLQVFGFETIYMCVRYFILQAVPRNN